MKINIEEARIYVRPGATDLRKGISGLCSIIGNEIGKHFNVHDNLLTPFYSLQRC